VTGRPSRSRRNHREEAEAYWSSQAARAVHAHQRRRGPRAAELREVHFAARELLGSSREPRRAAAVLGGQRRPLRGPFFAYHQHKESGTVTAALCDAAAASLRRGGARRGAVRRGVRTAARRPPRRRHRSTPNSARLLATIRSARHPAARGVPHSLTYLVRHAPVDEPFAAALDARSPAFRDGPGAPAVRTNAEDLPSFSARACTSRSSAVATARPCLAEIPQGMGGGLGVQGVRGAPALSIDHLSVRKVVSVTARSPTR
jgi:hypothetical protein